MTASSSPSKRAISSLSTGSASSWRPSSRSIRLAVERREQLYPVLWLGGARKTIGGLAEQAQRLLGETLDAVLVDAQGLVLATEAQASAVALLLSANATSRRSAGSSESPEALDQRVEYAIASSWRSCSTSADPWPASELAKSSSCRGSSPSRRRPPMRR